METHSQHPQNAGAFMQTLSAFVKPTHNIFAEFIEQLIVPEVPRGRKRQAFSQMAYAELLIAKMAACDLLDSADVLDRPVLLLVAKQVGDEARHYELMLRAVEAAFGTADLEGAMRAEKEAPLGVGSNFVDHMVFRLVHEGWLEANYERAAGLASADGFPEVARALEELQKDERSHTSIAEMVLPRLAEDPALRRTIWDKTARLIEYEVKKWAQHYYRPNPEDIETGNRLFEKHYGNTTGFADYKEMNGRKSWN